MKLIFKVRGRDGKKRPVAVTGMPNDTRATVSRREINPYRVPRCLRRLFGNDAEIQMDGNGEWVHIAVKKPGGVIPKLEDDDV